MKDKDLDVVDPRPSRRRSVMYLGEELVIEPLRIGQLPAFAAALGPILEDLKRHTHQPIDVVGVLAQAERFAEPLMNAAALVTGRPLEWIRDGDLGEFMLLATTILRVNTDFFLHGLVPQLSAEVRATREELEAEHGDSQTH